MKKWSEIKEIYSADIILCCPINYTSFIFIHLHLLNGDKCFLHDLYGFLLNITSNKGIISVLDALFLKNWPEYVVYFLVIDSSLNHRAKIAFLLDLHLFNFLLSLFINPLYLS